MGLRTKQVSSDEHGWNQTLLQAEAVKCPRCDSTNTKFCYYNNYNKSQPRYFCKTCKRHWTKGGTLRNVPVGGGRKNKRKALNAAGKPASKINSATTSTTTTTNTYSGIRDNNMIVQAQEPRLSLPIATLGGVDEKNLSEVFYQTLGRQAPCSMPESIIAFCSNSFNDSNDGIFLGSTLSLPQNDQVLHFPYSNLGFVSNPGSISSIQSPNLYKYTGEANGLEETVINSINAAMGSSSMSDHHHQQWSMATTTSNWGCDDFDKFVSVEADLTVPWDDSEIKP